MITLYKKGKIKDQVQVWTIEVEGGKLRTIEGIVDGKLTTSVWTECKPKNVGRANATTPEEQAKFEALSKAQKKRDKGYVDNIDDIKPHLEPTLAKVYEDYENSVTFPAVVSPKLDGIRCKATKDGLFTRNDKPILSCPHIINSLKEYFEKGGLPVDGELYNHALKDNFNKIVSLVKKQKPTQADLEESKSLIEYHIFDIQSPEFFSGRYITIMQELFQKDHLKVVVQKTALSKYDIEGFAEEFLEDGYEGAMVRWGENLKTYQYGRTKNLLKVKVFHTVEADIIDIQEGIGKRANTVGKYIIRQDNGIEQEAAPSGSDEYNAEIWARREEIIKKKRGTYKYQGVTPDGKLRFPIHVEIRDYE